MLTKLVITSVVKKDSDDLCPSKRPVLGSAPKLLDGKGPSLFARFLGRRPALKGSFLLFDSHGPRKRAQASSHGYWDAALPTRGLFCFCARTSGKVTKSRPAKLASLGGSFMITIDSIRKRKPKWERERQHAIQGNTRKRASTPLAPPPPPRPTPSSPSSQTTRHTCAYVEYLQSYKVGHPLRLMPSLA